jgi:hypothetical protein
MRRQRQIFLILVSARAAAHFHAVELVGRTSGDKLMGADTYRRMTSSALISQVLIEIFIT